MSAHAVDVTAATFEQEVLEASRSLPVVVDFWAPWCGPCRVLKPMLEKLAAEYGGKFKLAKVNADENPELSAAYGIRSIPDVMAFRDGEAVSHFLGAIPESQVRAFLDALVPTPSEVQRARARTLREAGDAAGAATALRQAIALDGGNDDARLDLAELQVSEGALDEAAQGLDALAAHPDRDARIANLRAALGFARAAQSGGAEAGLRERLGRDPADHEARLALAGLHAGNKRYRQAMDELLEIVRADKAWKSGEARRHMLALFNLAGEQPDLVSEYRRKLASALN
jgi:putative thioredoxin